MKTIDCQNYLVAKYGQELSNNYLKDISDREIDILSETDSEQIKWQKTLIKDIKKQVPKPLIPKQWKRMTKYIIGSKTDKEGSNSSAHTGRRLCDDYPQYRDWETDRKSVV